MPINWQTKKVQITSAELQWDGSDEALAVIKDFIGDESLYHYDTRSLMKLRVWNTLEKQWLNVPIGHWVVKGLRGEFYTCEPKAMDKKYFEVEEGDAVNIADLINSLQSIGESLAGPDYIKESDMVSMGDYLIELANKLERYGVK